MIGSTFPDESRLPPEDGAGILAAFTPVLQGADLAFGNLEGPMLEGGVSTKCGAPKAGSDDASGKANCFAFRVPTRYGRYLKDAGFRVMSLANNHAGDFGDEGRASTRAVLDGLGIQYAGSDRERFASTVVEMKGKKIGFIGFAHNNLVPNVNDVATARAMVGRLKKKVDLVVVSFHGGGEGVGHQHVPYGTEMFLGEPRGDLRVFTHAVIDAGADLVLGHGPHVMRGMEIYKDHLIAYSMGNFCTYGWFGLKEETALTAVFAITLKEDGTFLSGKLYPGEQLGRGGPVVDAMGKGIRVVRELSVADFGAGAPVIADDGTFRKQD